jgi:peptidyl-prolyl cis-trans isomerase A (cyclophilin A)
MTPFHWAPALSAAVLLCLAGCPKDSPTTISGTAAATVAPLLSPDVPDPRAPDRFTVRFETTKGDVLVDIYREWSPHGVDRLHRLVTAGFYEDVACYRVIKGFVVQFGIHPDPQVQRLWAEAQIPDDPVRGSNLRGTLTFASSGPNTRTVQLFFNLGDNSRLDAMGFPALGRVRDLDAVDLMFGGYGEGAPMGSGPDQERAAAEGAAYFRSEFPELDWILRTEIIPTEGE